MTYHSRLINLLVLNIQNWFICHVWLRFVCDSYCGEFWEYDDEDRDQGGIYEREKEWEERSWKYNCKQGGVEWVVLISKSNSIKTL